MLWDGVITFQFPIQEETLWQLVITCNCNGITTELPWHTRRSPMGKLTTTSHTILPVQKTSVLWHCKSTYLVFLKDWLTPLCLSATHTPCTKFSNLFKNNTIILHRCTILVRFLSRFNRRKEVHRLALSPLNFYTYTYKDIHIT